MANSSANDSRLSRNPFDTYSCMFSTTYTVFSVAVISVIIIPTVFGNMLILASILKFPNSFKGNLYIYIGNLAVTDLLLGVVLLLYPAEYIFPDLQESHSFCTLRLCLAVVCILVSEGTLALIGIERTMAVIRPIEHMARTMNTKMFKSAVVVLWIVSASGVMGPVYFQLSRRRPGTRGGRFVCRGSTLMPIYFHYITSAFIAISLIVNLIQYIVITRNLKRHVSAFPESKLAQGAKTMMMIVVMVVFAVSWAPFVTIQLVRSTSLHAARNTTYLCVSEYLVLLGFCNSGLNWIIYGFMNAKFRSAFIAVMRCKNILTNSNSTSRVT